MRAKLVATVGSHPCIGAEMMLRYKGIEYTRLDLPNMTHKAIMPLMRYRGTTVPALTIEGKRIVGSMRIARALEALVPEPPLFGDDSIESAEAWGDTVLQDSVRQLARTGTGKDVESMRDFISRPVMGIPASVMRKAVPVLHPVVSWQMRPKPGSAEACLAALPGQLDRVDALLAEGVIGGERLNAADAQIAPSVRLVLNFDQLREAVDARPAGVYARRLVPDYPGRFREVFPAAWLPF
jgi:glutathione S-transferase